MSLAPPFPTLSHYRLLELLGRGGMGEVWLAEDLELPRRVAIKLLPRHLAEDTDAVDRLLREARAAASVDHPNVVTVHEAGTVEGQPFLVMQRVEGETLEARLARGPLRVTEALALALGIADALAEVHALGIVHRDLKPSNIMLTPRGPKVLDFGLAALRGHPRMTEAGQVVGTPLFMSPEQVQGQAPDNRSDLWALGVILYQALTGARAFEGANLAAMAHAVLEQQPPPPSRANPAIPAALDGIVEKLLRKDRALRYGRAEDLIADLTVCAGASATAESNATTLAATAAMPATRHVPRLAVLYFEVLSADPEDAFLAAGLTEDLIVDLARVEGLRVAARGEVQPFRGRDLPPRTVARELNVEYVVQGSVRRAGQRARISAQLVRAADGQATWAERFDRTLDDLFEVQAEVSKRIVEALEVTLRPAEREMLDRAPTRNREAYALYLRGRALIDDSRRESSFRAEECLRQAVQLDPQFALAHAALAECLGRRAPAWWAGLEVVEVARPHAQRAIDLDPDLPEAHMAMGFVRRLEGDAEGLLAEITAASRPDTTDPLILGWAGWTYMTQGRLGDALETLERAHRLHPRHYRIASSLTDCYLALGRKDDERRMLDQMRETLLETLDREPDNVDARIILAISLAQMGDRDAGIAQAERALAAAPDDGRVRYNAACTFAHAGETERAIEQLRAMVSMVPSYLTDWVRRDPDLASLRGHPEFVRMFGEAGGSEVVKPLVLFGALALMAWVLWDTFETVLQTRRVPARLRISRFLARWLWSVWSLIASRITARGRRETFLSFYALLATIGMYVAWAAGLIVAFALLHWAEGSHLAGVIGTGGGVVAAGFGADLYMSGTTFFTLGLGDLHPMTDAARVITVVEAGMGFGLLALVIAYVPVLYQSFARREARITMLDEWAGSPPSAAVMLRRSFEARDPNVIGPLLRDWEVGSSEILESHLSYPILCFFRSQHDNQSWLGALVAILDTCVLVIVGVEGIDPFQARLTFAIARHALVDLSQIFRLKPEPAERLRMSATELAELRTWLAGAGVRLREGAEADRRLAELRDLYLPYAHQISRVLLMPLPPLLPPPRARYNWKTTQWGMTQDDAH